MDTRAEEEMARRGSLTFDAPGAAQPSRETFPSKEKFSDAEDAPASNKESSRSLALDESSETRKPRPVELPGDAASDDGSDAEVQSPAIADACGESLPPSPGSRHPAASPDAPPHRRRRLWTPGALPRDVKYHD